MARSAATTITREQAAAYLVGQLGLARPAFGRAGAGVRAVLSHLRCIQLDPLDTIGTNADLVVMARVPGVTRGAVFRHVYPGHAFEHFAKERCLLPATAFPWYRDQAAETPWWRLGDRLKRLPDGVVERVYDEIAAHGPRAVGALADHGKVEPLDWSGWKGTARAAAMAVEVLWTQCRIVVCGRRGGAKLYDVPDRALPAAAREVPGPGGFARWAVCERAEAAGLLSRAGGAHWSMLYDVRTSELPDRLVAEGLLEDVVIDGASRRYLAPAGFRTRTFPAPDARMRILGPLDPLLWDRALVRHVFGFDYVWEVYKPKEQRRWGWYVCPLLHRGRLVGRLEGRVVEGSRGRTLRIARIWREGDVRFDEDALDEALARHAAACGAERVVRAKSRPNP